MKTGPKRDESGTEADFHAQNKGAKYLTQQARILDTAGVEQKIFSKYLTQRSFFAQYRINAAKLRQRRLQILHNLRRQHIRTREQLGIFQAVILYSYSF